MFKRIVIEMRSPLCTCGVDKLNWAISVDDDDDELPGLVIRCKVCGMKLVVPPKKFVAVFDIEPEFRADIKVPIVLEQKKE